VDKREGGAGDSAVSSPLAREAAAAASSSGSDDPPARRYKLELVERLTTQSQNQARLARVAAAFSLETRLRCAPVHSRGAAPDALRVQERLLLEQARDTEDGLTANLYWFAPAAPPPQQART